MKELKQQVTIKFFLGNKEYAQRTAFHVPNVGNEIRLRNGEYYSVKRIVWVYDEPEHVHSRVNIEIKQIEE